MTGTPDIFLATALSHILGNQDLGNGNYRTARITLANLMNQITALSSGVAYKTYANLAARTNLGIGTPGTVYTDAGTHTDPVVGGTVANAGMYRWSASPAGWERIGDLSFTVLQTNIDNLAAELCNENLIADSSFAFWPDGNGPFTASGYTSAIAKLFKGTGATVSVAQFLPTDHGVAALSFDRSVTGSGSSIIDIPIPGLAFFSGQTVTLSVDIKADAGTVQHGLNLVADYGTGGTAAEGQGVQLVSSNTSWVRQAKTFVIGDITTGKTYGPDDSLKIRFQRATTDDDGKIYIRRPKLEIGTRATPWVQPDLGRERAKLARVINFGVARAINGDRYIQYSTMRDVPVVTVSVGTSAQERPTEFVWTHSAQVNGATWKADARIP